jgi:hypothetical protein
MAQAEIEDFGLDIFGGRRVNGLAQFLHQELDKFGASTLKVFAKGLGSDLSLDDLAELGGDVVYRSLGIISA